MRLFGNYDFEMLRTALQGIFKYEEQRISTAQTQFRLSLFNFEFRFLYDTGASTNRLEIGRNAYNPDAYIPLAYVNITRIAGGP